MTAADGIRTDAESDPAIAALSAILLDGLRALTDAGEADMACRLAGRACAALRQNDATQWRRFNVLLHRLGPRSSPVGTPRPAPDG
ncbi:MAG: hypothetical protein BGP16_11380 [Sphingobium sp. 66-54]|nr:MAG: hypothetical protein BGP16_11380 [Sphingobium sp. 66-54]